MKITIKNFIIFFLLITTAVCFASCSNTTDNTVTKSEIKNIVYMDQHTLYASYENLDDAFTSSDVVVYGEIIKLGQSHFPSYDEKKQFCQTPVTLKIINCIKGDITEESLVYDSGGGVIGDTKYISTVYRTDEFKIGDKILVFLKMDKRYDTYNEISPTTTFYGGQEGYARVSADLLKSAKSNTEDNPIQIKPVLSLDDFAEILKTEYQLYVKDKEFVTE